MQFQAEINQLLQLMIHSLYSSKEVFLRELISSTSDVLDEPNFLSASDNAYKGLKFEPKIGLKLNRDKKTLTISDNDIGTNKGNLVNHPGTIAESGTEGFLENLSGDAKEGSQLIGQFGVGFYSVFMVTDKIEVLSRKVLENETYLWSSNANGYEIEEVQRGTRGTSVTLHFRGEEFLNEFRVEGIVEKYSNHI